MKVNEELLIDRLRKKDEAAFEQVFKTHYKSLYAYACSMLQDDMSADETVQNVFFKLWERNEKINISGSIASYLYRAVHNEALNYLKHLKVRNEYRLYIVRNVKEETDSASKRVQTKELEQRLKKTLNDLPEQCRTIFQMSRFEELNYRQIAERMGLSVKTVENQMGKALKILRAQLAEFLAL